MPPLCFGLPFPLDRLAGAAPHLRPEPGWRFTMADIVFLALGAGAFALFGWYAALLRKV
jgi:hypothetical protein